VSEGPFFLFRASRSAQHGPRQFSFLRRSRPSCRKRRVCSTIFERWWWPEDFSFQDFLFPLTTNLSSASMHTSLIPVFFLFSSRTPTRTPRECFRSGGLKIHSNSPILRIFNTPKSYVSSPLRNRFFSSVGPDRGSRRSALAPAVNLPRQGEASVRLEEMLFPFFPP